MMDFNYGNGWWGPGMLVVGIFWLVLIGFGAWAVVRLTRRSEGLPPGSGFSGPGFGPHGAGPAYGGQPGGGESARQILDRRFASGEIDAATYAEMRRVLEGRSVDPPRD